MLISSAAFAQTNKQISYPPTVGTKVTDSYFGTVVPDPYRWLENDTAANVKDWVKKENVVTHNYIDSIPFRKNLESRLKDLYNYTRVGSPFREGEYYFFSKNEGGLQNQSVIYYQKGLDGTPTVFLDPNTLSKDGTTAASLLGFSSDHKTCCVSIQRAGSDWQELYVMDVPSAKFLSDTVKWVKFSGAAFYKDGFYYSRFDAPVKGKEYSSEDNSQKVFYHKIGDKQENDELIFEDKTHPKRYLGADITEDERFLVIDASEGTSGTEIWVKDLTTGQKVFSKILPGFDNDFSIINNIDDKLLVFTNANAKNFQLVLVDPLKPEQANWKKIIPETNDLLQSVTTAAGKIFATYLKDVSNHVYQYDMNGKMEREISLPGIGNAGGFGGKKDEPVIFYSFTSFNYPTTIFKYDFKTGTSTVWRKPEVKFIPADFEVEQVVYPSKDGTGIHMFIVHKKGMKLDGNNPCYLYGYGGFNISIQPAFSLNIIPFLENGGIYCVANLRGGGEYGESWHQAGMLLNKQNVFDDFIAAAEYLITQKYTSASKLAIGGRSNGGLLVGAAMTQRPDLFKVAIPGVGVMDMLRYHKFTIGWGWAVEYGSSDDSINFKNLYKYSPLHNLKKGVQYPATLVTTADHDDRVVPAHSFKFAATLQANGVGTNPYLIRIETNAGHGSSGSGAVSKVIPEQADVWSFIMYNLGMNPIFSDVSHK